MFAPYAQVARRSFQRLSTYRSAAGAGVFTNTVFAFLKAYVLLAVFRQHRVVGSLDATGVVTFTFVVEGLSIAVGSFADVGLTARIRTGDVVSDLYRPLDFAGYWLADDLGRAGFQLMARSLPPVLIGALFFALRLPPNLATWAAFAATVVLAWLVSFGFRFLVSLSSFWILDNRGPNQLAGFVLAFFSGFVLPITFLPTGLARVARLLPFAAMLQLPAEVFLGQHQGIASLAGVLAQQVAWAVALLGLSRLVVGRAIGKLVVQGG